MQTFVTERLWGALNDSVCPWALAVRTQRFWLARTN